MTKIKYGCDVQRATCTLYETALPEFSSITDCPDIDATTTELYSLVGDIREENDLSNLGENCITYTLVSGKLPVKNALLKLEEEVCALKEEIETLKTTDVLDRPITGLGLDTSCLTDSCGESISTYKELFQALIDKVCTP